ncbi:vacuolar sorting protein 28 (VPS28) family protein [Babesia bovis T2Bo]|uniref:vacuolar sorting protein 28 (VPS28) family protein n=1 Tax=Babesia bovis T2Bo TaxID=484906 RepID=UPI001DAC9769|nr:vacuolar sorting protein 28 (VPS28) family protein [Babesia bovis T2Bo]EDO07390.2 vacuolar sorting protein 28 (VPS28) family protein [Babesia bovis T2Bo]
MTELTGQSETLNELNVDRLANVYSLLQALEHLEDSFISGYVTEKEYAEECNELLSLCQILEEATPNVFEALAKEYNVKCPLALNRLRKGTPGIQNNNIQKNKSNDAYLMFELSEQFITLVDALKLGCNSVEEIYPLIHDLVTSLSCLDKTMDECNENNVVGSAIEKLGKWDTQLKGMAAYDKLQENELRQMALDTETIYGSFKIHLRTQV